MQVCVEPFFFNLAKFQYAFAYIQLSSSYDAFFTRLVKIEGNRHSLFLNHSKINGKLCWFNPCLEINVFVAVVVLIDTTVKHESV